MLSTSSAGTDAAGNPERRFSVVLPRKSVVVAYTCIPGGGAYIHAPIRSSFRLLTEVNTSFFTGGG